MLVTRIKAKSELEEIFSGPGVAIRCFGCKEVFFPEEEVLAELAKHQKNLVGSFRLDYLCREEFSQEYLKKLETTLNSTNRLVVFSCGVGVQVWAKLLPEKLVLAGCDTVNVNGFQGLTPPVWQCRQCGECWLNVTGAICPLTACSKGLLNGPCGGAKNGKCEVHPAVDCGWLVIYKRVQAIKQPFLSGRKVATRDYRRLITGTTTREA
ncbi:MAG: methylenetetrahydrofolate reductase C-terminal domain-containing protein [Candidatus Omnitrophica bacterium]|nr:methylenetetrahydrofolate reductase C-terminal domain-containing protein [Candidatus Omnitrophota bacterium]